MNRISKHDYYLGLAKEVAQRSTCIRNKYGAVLVKNDRVISTGYNGSPRGTVNCCDIGKCIRIEQSIPSGTRYETCRAVHAEANALLNANPVDRIDSTLYLYGVNISNESANISAQRSFMECCSMCKRLIINCQVKQVINYNSDNSINIIDVENDWVYSSREVI